MKPVTIYTSASCGYCHKAKAYLKEQGVPFTEKHADTDPVAQQELGRMKAKGVPVIVVGDEIIMGFDQHRLEALFGKKIAECPNCRQKMRYPRDKGVLQLSCPKCGTKFKVNSSL